MESNGVSGDPLVILEHLAVGYGRQAVLSEINLHLQAGSFTGLLGANGSGKSTLLKTILGILPPLAGRITLSPISGRPPVLGYMPQRESLDPIFLLSSLEIVLMGVCGRVAPGWPIRKAERDFSRQCLEEVGAADLADRLFSRLSGGQKQRVLMARALATRPDFFVLDEPTAGIDTNATRALMEGLRRIHQKQRLTILLVSHDLPTVRQYASEVIWLHAGRILQGSADELLKHDKLMPSLNP